MLYDTIEFPDGMPLKCVIAEVEEYPFHMHDDVLEIIFALDGALELTVVNNVLQMRAGDIYVCCPRELHRLCAYEHTRGAVMLLHIDLEAYQAEFPDLHTYQFANSALEANSAGIRILGNYLKMQLPKLLDKRGLERSYVTKVGEKILNTLIKEFQCYYLGSYFPEFNNAYKGNEIQLKRIRRVTDHIYRNYNKPLKIEDLAAMEHISANHLTCILKNGCGVSFRMFLNMARVEKSATMLLEGNKGLQTIAYECGFSKYKYFSECFEKVFRTTPQQYRQKYQGCTIAVQARRVKTLEAEELEALLRRFCSRAEEIKLDMNGKQRMERFGKLGYIDLTGFPYDHITCFPLLRRLKEEISFDTLGIDLAFLRRYRNDLRALSYILTDLWSLRVGLRICLPCGEPGRGLRGCLEFLEELSEKLGGAVELVVLAESGGDDEKAMALERSLSSCRFPVRVESGGPAYEKNPLYGSGYMPSYLLHQLVRGERPWEHGLALLEHTGGSRGPALLTPAGLKKPVYHLLYLLERMGDTVLARGNMYVVTRKAGRADIQVLIYHYDECFDDMFRDGANVTEQLPFMDLMLQDHDYNREITLQLHHMVGNFALRKYRLTAEEYETKYREAPFLSYEGLSEETLRVLNASLAPEVTLSMLELDGAYALECKLAPFEIMLLSFEKL